MYPSGHSVFVEGVNCKVRHLWRQEDNGCPHNCSPPSASWQSCPVGTCQIVDPAKISEGLKHLYAASTQLPPFKAAPDDCTTKNDRASFASYFITPSSGKHSITFNLQLQ